MRLKYWFSLEGTTCVVAGANGLLGKACCQALAEAGANVIALDLSFTGKDWGTSLEIDLTKVSEVEAFFKVLPGSRARGRSWAFINCSYPRTANWGELGFENFTLRDWNKNLELHLGSAFLFTQKSVDFLVKKGGGSLLNFGSIYGVQGPDLRIYKGTSMKNPVAYSAIKAGIIGLTRYVATTYGAKGVRANVICPGGVKGKQPAAFRKAYEARTPLGRMAMTEDIAGVVSFLVGPSARYITGQTIMVDGGWTAW